MLWDMSINCVATIPDRPYTVCCLALGKNETVLPYQLLKEEQKKGGVLSTKILTKFKENDITKLNKNTLM